MLAHIEAYKTGALDLTLSFLILVLSTILNAQHEVLGLRARPVANGC